MKKDNWWEDSKIVKKTRVEEYLDIDESLIELEKNNQIIRLDMNTIEFPIFSKDTRRSKNQIKVYYFKTDKSAYLEVEPLDGYAIPGEFEERVFIALTKIMRNNNYGQTFLVTAKEIIKNLNLKNERSGIYFKKLKQAIKTLAKTSYTFKNSLYSNEAKGIINDEIHTTMMNIRIITRKDSESNQVKQFEDGRVKEVYKISFSDHFYRNIITKGYLVFDSEKLLEISNSVTRSIYTMIEKWRAYELYLKRPAFFIARRVPLTWDKRKIGRTIKIIEKSCNELKEMKLIKGFHIIKNKKWELAEFEFFFEEKHNKMKRDSFYKEKKDFSNIDMYVAHIEKRAKEKESIENNLPNKNIKESVEIILNTLPYRAKKLKTMPNFIEQSLKKHSFDYVKGTAEYVYTKNPKSVKAYFNKALLENWAEEYIVAKQTKNLNKIKINEQKKDIIEETKIIKKTRTDEQRKKLDEFYKKLNEVEQKNIKNLIENAIIEKAGQLQKSVLAVMVRNSSSRYDMLEKLMKNFKEKKEEKENKVKFLYNIEKEFKNITSFSMEILKILKKLEIKRYTDILEVLKMFEEFNDDLEGYKIDLKYLQDEKSYIRISEGGIHE